MFLHFYVFRDIAGKLDQWLCRLVSFLHFVIQCYGQLLDPSQVFLQLLHIWTILYIQTFVALDWQEMKINKVLCLIPFYKNSTIGTVSCTWQRVHSELTCICCVWSSSSACLSVSACCSWSDLYCACLTLFSQSCVCKYYSSFNMITCKWGHNIFHRSIIQYWNCQILL